MAFRGQKETADLSGTGTQVKPQQIDCGGVSKAGLFLHPPWQGGTGYCYALYDPCTLPSSPAAAFRASVGKADGSDPGDGILYKLVVIDASGAETVAAETSVAHHAWTPFEADLSRWAGRTVRLKLITDVGPKDDPTGDWGAWADIRVETLQPILNRRAEAAKR
jgi:hypothetical protein